MDQLKLNMTSQGQSESDPSLTSDVAIPDDIPTSDATTPELRHSSRTRRPLSLDSHRTIINCARRGGMLYIVGMHVCML